MSVTIEITVVPSSGRSEFKLEKTGRVKAYLKSAPEKGKANTELIKLIADAVGCSRQDIEIIAGATARKKIIKIHRPLAQVQILKMLGLELQAELFGKKEK